MTTLNRLLKYCLYILLIGLLQTSFADDENDEAQCLRPEETPSVPDGRRSTKGEMTEAMQQVRDYLSASTAYRECVQALLDRQGDSASENVRKAAKRLIQESLETDELLGELFNQQVRIFKSINPED